MWQKCQLLVSRTLSISPIAPRHAASRHAGRHARCAALRMGPSIKYVTLFDDFWPPPSPVTNCHKSWTPPLKVCHTSEQKVNKQISAKWRLLLNNYNHCYIASSVHMALVHHRFMMLPDLRLLLNSQLRISCMGTYWAGFTNCEDNARLQSVLNEVQQAGFFPPNFQKFKQIVDAADVQLFRSIISNEDHILHQLLPAVKINSHNLRKRAHNFEIPRCEDSLMRKNFIIRSLLANSYWIVTIQYNCIVTIQYNYNIDSVTNINSFIFINIFLWLFSKWLL